MNSPFCMRGDYHHNKTCVSCNYRKHFIMKHYILLFYLVLHYVCQIRYTALCIWIWHFVLTLRISIFDFAFHYADVTLCMMLSERIVVANRATLEPSAPHANVSRHILDFHTIQHGKQRFGKFRKCQSRNVSTLWSCSRPCSRQLAKWYYAHNSKTEMRRGPNKWKSTINITIHNVSSIYTIR
jgi:hypothetical protein